MNREALPLRRLAETMQVSFAGEKYVLTKGYYPDGRIGEVFLDRIKDKTASRLGYALDGVCRDSAMMLSLLLQHGATIQSIAHTVTRDDDNEPATVLGAICDLLLKEERK